MIQPPNQSKIVLYSTTDGQAKMVEFFGVQRPAITKHLKNIFKSGESGEKVVSSILEHTTKYGAISGKAEEKSTVSKMETVQQEWKLSPICRQLKVLKRIGRIACE